jgi:Na+/proline symporter
MGVGRDVVKRFFKSNLPDKQLLNITRWAVLGFTLAVLATCLAQPEAIVKFAELGGSIFACTFFAPLFFGSNWRRVTKNAVFWSMILGGGIDIILWIGWRFMGMPLLFGIQPVLYGITASILTLVVITLRSDPTPGETKEFERITTRMEIAAVAVGANQSNAVIRTMRIDGYDWTCILSIIVGLALAIGGTVILPP